MWFMSDLHHSHHNVFQLHVQHVCPMDILLPVIWVFIRVHVVQDQLKEDELLGDGAERVVKTEHVVSILSFHTGGKAQAVRAYTWNCAGNECFSDRQGNLRVHSV